MLTHSTAMEKRIDDLRVVCASVASRRPVDPALERKIHDEADRARDALRKRGVSDIAVELIREGRDER